MAIYKYRLTYDRFPNFAREYEVKDTNTLYDFHRFIQNDLDYDEAQLSAFHTADKSWNKGNTYTLFDMGGGAMDVVTAGQLVKNGVVFMLYTFDVHNGRMFKIEFLGEVDAMRLTSYPRVAMAKGDQPDQIIETDPIDNLTFIEANNTPKPASADDDDLDDLEEDEDDDDDQEEEVFEEDEL